MSQVAQRRCEFCGTPLANRGEAYYDHLTGTRACHEAWDAWTTSMNEDRVGG